MYEYKAVVLRVVDGDTVDLDIDLGMRTHTLERIRLDGLNAPELHSKDQSERDAAKVSADFLRSLLADPNVVIKTKKDSQEKYGRYLGTIFNSAGENVNEAMIKTGHAVPYSGGAR